jgi:hypothetical protein
MVEQRRRYLLSLLNPSIMGFVCYIRRAVGTKPELQWSECDQHHYLSYEASREREAVDPDKVRKATFRMRKSITAQYLQLMSGLCKNWFDDRVCITRDPTLQILAIVFARHQ